MYTIMVYYYVGTLQQWVKYHLKLMVPHLLRVATEKCMLSGIVVYIVIISVGGEETYQERVEEQLVPCS